ncbi:phage major capsid protein [Parvularcula sp. ZS-1/3]|uniref:Phage major capsid protein n=1 Tax=Parvularcula mediterranea TaxID=2732508 RepID=A0A7Y3W644_9PROT|nr:phage major capsid protein [Parvularcula mediterranea]NNU16987.1 phage major capsid protein [Parvularcula mediterranea]
MTLETKHASVEEKALAADLLHTFEAFKSENDQRLDAIEKRGHADPLQDTKLRKIEASLNEQKAAIDRLAISAQRSVQADEAPEQKRAFEQYIRAGILTAPEEKSLSGSSDADGGYTVPTTIETAIDRALTEVSPFRSFCSVRQISSSTYRVAVNEAAYASGWVGETDARPETTTPSIAAIEFKTGEIYAMPAATPQLLEDSAVDIEAWIASEVRGTFASAETDAFVNGDGVNKPLGFLQAPNATDATRTATEIGTLAGGIDGDSLIELVYALDSRYRENGRFVFNRHTAEAIRKLKGSDGTYLWTPGIAAGQPATLLGYPVAEVEAMPNAGAGANAVAFGDFSAGYLIVDRKGVQVLRDPFSAKPYVLFYTTKRVGGGVQDHAAIKLLSTS